ncbi:MAG: hypothetical protein RIF32_13480 [Leptospirales bacterium]|jgi:hypothetical protein
MFKISEAIRCSGFALLCLSGAAVLPGCASGPADSAGDRPPFVEPEGGRGVLPPNSTLPPHYRREGLISSNSYQVHVTVLAASKAEARILGEDAGKQRAAELMQNERVISSRIGYYGREEIRRLVENEGQVVLVHPENNGGYTVVLQVYKAGLTRFLQKLY